MAVIVKTFIETSQSSKASLICDFLVEIIALGGAKYYSCGDSQSFSGMFKETALACLFDIGRLIAGFMIALN